MKPKLCGSEIEWSPGPTPPVAMPLFKIMSIFSKFTVMNKVCENHFWIDVLLHFIITIIIIITMITDVLETK